MSDDMRQVVRSEETVVAGDPVQQTTVTQQGVAPVAPVVATPVAPATPVVAAPVAPVAATPVVAAPVAPVMASTVQTTATPPGDRVVAHTEAIADINPAADRAANLNWVNSLVWFLAGLIIVLLAVRFILAMTGADPHAGFAALIYGLSSPFRAPFAGLFGAPITYDGAVTAGRLEFEDLVAMVVYAVIAWGLTKLFALMLGTNRNRGTVVTDTTRRTQL
jgi:YggT family protein